jgi:hypothetical protein
VWKDNVVRIYTGPDNRSHFEDLSLPLDAIMMEGHAQHRSPTMPIPHAQAAPVRDHDLECGRDHMCERLARIRSARRAVRFTKPR